MGHIALWIADLVSLSKYFKINWVSTEGMWGRVGRGLMIQAVFIISMIYM